MIRIDRYITNQIHLKNIKDKIRSTLKEMGYHLAIDDAHEELHKLFGVPNPSISNSVGIQRHIFREFEFMRNRISMTPDVTWSTVFRINKQGGFCIVSYSNAENEIDQSRSNKTYEISLAIVTLEDATEEIDEIKNEFVKNIPEITDWKYVKHVNEHFHQLSKELSSPSYSESDFIVAKKLSDKKINQVVKMLKATGGGMLRRDFVMKLSEVKDIDEVIQTLIDLGIVKSEFAVICKKNSEQVNRVPNREIIDIMGDHGVKCKCGKPVNEEMVEEILSTTDMANKMMNGNNWMTINLIEVLDSLGILMDDILVNVSDGPDEIDAFVSISGRLLMFELKDSQFSMGHAYAFGGRVGIYRPTQGIIWATEGVAPEVKDHFTKVKPETKLHYIEGAESLYSVMEKMLNDIRWEIAEEVLRPILKESIFVYNLPGGIIEYFKTIVMESEEGEYEKQVAATNDY
ncbi:hypothetical protein [Tumebacillus flagellatus]|uniref:Uncharacterized protein n=1 Tax=Tumebacillus flagellatus TaxID=1157490 RepID=A0A074LIE8_9BACL|nr:hypothetical protein [Tumebacillus flagellatus]KEO80914.1 hypothetical protein EL26_23710 [Tumebacillus flagellatus]